MCNWSGVSHPHWAVLSLGGGQAVQLGQIDFVLKSCTSLNGLTLSMNFANFLYGSEISEVDLKSIVSRFVAKWGQVVLVSSRDLKSTFSHFGIKWGQISILAWLPGLLLVTNLSRCLFAVIVSADMWTCESCKAAKKLQLLLIIYLPEFFVKIWNCCIFWNKTC